MLGSTIAKPVAGAFVFNPAVSNAIMSNAIASALSCAGCAKARRRRNNDSYGGKERRESLFGPRAAAWAQGVRSPAA
jgi:hypothetical protein